MGCETYRKLRGSRWTRETLSRLLKRDKWTSNSPHIKDQPLTIYIDDDYKHHLQSNQKISLKSFIGSGIRLGLDLDPYPFLS